MVFSEGVTVFGLIVGLNTGLVSDCASAMTGFIFGLKLGLTSGLHSICCGLFFGTNTGLAV